VATRVSLLLVYVCAIGVVARADSPVQPVARVLLAFDADTPRGAIRSNAVDEAARLWAPYGVLVAEDDGTACETSTHVRVEGARDRRSQGENGLGFLRFSSDGVPDSTLAVDYAAVARLATTAPLFGVDASAWPLRLRDDVVGRATGRTLAHEIGHYLLRSPGHASSGLMRSTLRVSDLTRPERAGLNLTPVNVARLQIVIAAGVLQQPSTIGSTLSPPVGCLMTR
jgi:hypothetical protein